MAADLPDALSAEGDLKSRFATPMPRADADEIVATFERYRLMGEMLHLAIADRASDQYLGEVMLMATDEGVAEIGCGLNPLARGRGIATEAIVEVATWALMTLGLARVEAYVAVENEAGLRLAANAGFHLEGRLRSAVVIEGVRHDAAIFSMIRSDLA